MRGYILGASMESLINSNWPKFDGPEVSFTISCLFKKSDYLISDNKSLKMQKMIDQNYEAKKLDKISGEEPISDIIEILE